MRFKGLTLEELRQVRILHSLHSSTVHVNAIITLLSLYLSVSTHAVIGQFCGPYFTVWLANFENVILRAPDLLQRYNRYLTNLVFSVRTVSYGSSFFSRQFMARALRAWAISKQEKTQSVTYSTDLKLG